MKRSAHIPIGGTTQPGWLDALIALVRSLLDQLYGDIILPLAYGPHPSPQRLARMAEQFAHAERELLIATHNAVRLHAGLDAESPQDRFQTAPPRTGAAFARRLKIHHARLNNPQIYVTRLLYRMFRHAEQSKSPAALFDPPIPHPARLLRSAHARQSHAPRAIELSG